MQLLPLYNSQLTEQLPTVTFFPLLEKGQCETIIEKFKVVDPEMGRVSGRLDKDKRNALVHAVPKNDDSAWLYELIANRVALYNQFGYDFDVSGIYTDLQLLEYREGCHYGWHVDIGPGQDAYRKLSVIIQLSAPDDYEGGEVVFNAGTERPLPKDRGQIAVFPSYVLHKVDPVTKGKRYALVCWVQGQRRFR